MTSETRTFIDATDIAGVEVECQSCHSTIFYPIAAVSDAKKLIANCPQCNHGMFDVLPFDPQSQYAQFPSYPATEDLQQIASALRSLVRKRTDIHANIRFRIDANSDKRQ